MEETSPQAAAVPRRGGFAAILAALCLYALASLAVFHRSLLEGEVLSASSFLLPEGAVGEEGWRSRNIILGDSAHCYMPWQRYASDAWRTDGHLPFWKSTAFCGAPLLGNGQSALLDPLNVLALALGVPTWIHGLLAAIKLVAACWFTFLLARWLGLGFAGALLAGFVFGLGGFTTVFLLFPLTSVSMLFPLLVLAADRVAQNPTAPRIILVALVCALQHLSGHPETTFQTQALAGLWGLVRVVAVVRGAGSGRGQALREGTRRGLLLLAGFVAGALLGAVQSLPLLEYIAESGMLRQRRKPPSWLVVEHPLASLVFVVGLVVAVLALRRLLLPRSRPLPWSVLLVAGVAVGLTAGLHAGLRDYATVLLTSEWFGGPNDYAGAANYIEANCAFAGAAIPLALLGLALGRPRALMRALGVLLAIGLLVGLRAPVAADLVQALPVFRLATNSRFQMFALLALALLAGAAIDVLRVRDAIIPRGTAWRFLLATLSIVVGALLGFGRASHDGVFLHPRDVLPHVEQQPLLATIDRAATDNQISWTIVGRAAPPRTPVTGALLFGTEDAVPVKLGVLTDSQSALGASSSETWLFTAQIPASEFTGQGLYLLLADETGAQFRSSLLYPRAAWEGATSFPSLPHGRKGLHQIGLLLVASFVVAAAAGSRPALRASLAIVAGALVVFSLGTFALVFHPTLATDLFYPTTPAITFLRNHTSDGRIMLGALPAFHPEVSTYHGIPDVLGYDALTPVRIEWLLREANPLSAPKSLRKNREDIDLRLLGLMSVHYLDRPAGTDHDPEPIVIERLGRNPLMIHENPAFLPRARLVTGALVEPDDDRALALLRDPGIDPSTTVVLASGTPASPAAASPGTARLEADRPDRVRIAVRATAPCHLVLSDTDFPGWRAFVDDREVPILRANIAFRAVALEPGAHVVEFRYQPRSFWLGVLLAFLGVGLLTALAILPHRTAAPA